MICMICNVIHALQCCIQVDDDIKAKHASGKKHEVEAFLRVEDGMVLVKYLEHDEPEMQPVSHMKSELSATAYRKFMKQLTGV
jgi:hypothetical protein